MESDDKIIKPAFGIMSSAGSVSIPPILIFKIKKIIISCGKSLNHITVCSMGLYEI